jgi:hypothetical protein
MQRNQWSFSYKIHELNTLLQEKIATLEERILLQRERIPLEKAEREVKRQALQELGESSMQMRARLPSEAELHNDEKKLEECHRLQRLFEREDPHRMMKLHIDDAEFFDI